MGEGNLGFDEEEEPANGELPNEMSRGVRAMVGLIALAAFGVGGAATFLTANQWAAVAFVVVGAFLLIVALLGELPSEIRAGGDRAVVSFARKFEQSFASRVLESLHEDLDRSRRTRLLPRLVPLTWRTQSSATLDESIESAIRAAGLGRDTDGSAGPIRHTFVTVGGNTVAVLGFVFGRSRTALKGDFRSLDAEVRRCLELGIRNLVIAARWASRDSGDQVLMPFLVREHGQMLSASVRYVEWPAVPDEAVQELQDCAAHFDAGKQSP